VCSEAQIGYPNKNLFGILNKNGSLMSESSTPNYILGVEFAVGLLGDILLLG
jgi:hypothetical protein